MIGQVGGVIAGKLVCLNPGQVPRNIHIPGFSQIGQACLHLKLGRSGKFSGELKFKRYDIHSCQFCICIYDLNLKNLD